MPANQNFQLDGVTHNGGDGDTEATAINWLSSPVREFYRYESGGYIEFEGEYTHNGMGLGLEGDYDRAENMSRCDANAEVFNWFDQLESTLEDRYEYCDIDHIAGHIARSQLIKDNLPTKVIANDVEWVEFTMDDFDTIMHNAFNFIWAVAEDNE